MNVEQNVLDNLRILPSDKKQEVLDFIEFLVQKIVKDKQLGSDELEKSDSLEPLSLKELVKLPIAERHQILAPCMAATSEDFLNDPELTEFSVLDGEDWETEND
ncbi:MAG: DUF2281 domain-containing protein [Scytonematopsis contorta HA4267-MV1]|nr:DUF2281 domain-containing protein [Scytonematopsis contorta HA4267-MV1]